MEKPENPSSLPKVEQDDLIALYMEELASEKYMDLWYKYEAENPVIANEVLARSYQELERSAAAGENRSQMHMRILMVVAISARAMEIVLERTAKDDNDASINVVDDGADQQP
jgi:hypothetical protein